MKVILNTTVPKLGKEGQIVSVADGYARNYLFPRGLAIVADKNQVKALEKKQARLAAKIAEGLATAEALKQELDGKTIRIAAKVGKDSTKLFGAVTAQDIADAIKTQLGKELDRKKIALIEPIKRLGSHQIHIDLHRDVDAFVTLEVFDPEAESAAAPETQNSATVSAEA